MTPEGKIKFYLATVCKNRGWLCMPLENPSMLGWPDRTLMVRSTSRVGYIAFVETKAAGVGHRKDHLERQRVCQGMILDLGFPVFVARTKEEVDLLAEELESQHMWPVYWGGR